MKKHISIAWVRGSFGNMFEGQNYALSKDFAIKGVVSKYPLSSNFPFPVTHLFSIADIPSVFGLQKNHLVQHGLSFIANRFLGDSQVLFGFKNAVKDADIVHIADPHYYYSYQAALLKQKGIIKKLILTSWETIPHNNESVAKKKNHKYVVYSAVDLFLCYTEAAEKVLLTEGVHKKKIRRVHLGVDLTRFYPAAASPKDFVIVTAARLVPEKGINEVYEAFKTVYKTHKDIKLQFIGDGPLKSKLEKEIIADNLQSVVTIRSIDYEQIPQIYRNASLFVLASKKTNTWEEQLGMVLMEAMASGLAIIATDTGAIPEIVSTAGVIVKPENSTMLALSIQKLLEEPKKRNELATLAYKRARQFFDSQKTACEIGTIYTSLYEDPS